MSEPALRVTDAELNPDELYRAATLSETYCSVTIPDFAVNREHVAEMAAMHPCCELSESQDIQWSWGRISAIADGIPSIKGVGPLKAARYVLAEHHVAHCDQLVVDEAGIQLLVRRWLASRGVMVVDTPAEPDA